MTDAVKLLTAGPPSSRTVKMDAPESRRNAPWFRVGLVCTTDNVNLESLSWSAKTERAVASSRFPLARSRAWPTAIRWRDQQTWIVIVEAGRQLYSATKEVKVTVGSAAA